VLATTLRIMTVITLFRLLNDPQAAKHGTKQFCYINCRQCEELFTNESQSHLTLKMLSYIGLYLLQMTRESLCHQPFVI